MAWPAGGGAGIAGRDLGARITTGLSPPPGKGRAILVDFQRKAGQAGYHALQKVSVSADAVSQGGQTRTVGNR